MRKPQVCVINALFDEPLFCLFCSDRIIDTMDDKTPMSPCRHVLFVADNDGYIFTSKTFETIKLTEIDKFEDPDEDFIDSILNSESFPDDTLIIHIPGPPSEVLGYYVALAPSEELDDSTT